MISFTRRNRDRSNETGFQFEFFCDRCNVSHITDFVYDPMGVAASLATAASFLLGRGHKYSAAGREINRLMRGKVWEDNYAAAVEKAKAFFSQCHRCNGWVCGDRCWNKEVDMCFNCVPSLHSEALAAKADAAQVQLFMNALDTDQTGGIDMSKRIVATCEHCKAAIDSPGAFCSSCGKRLQTSVFCAGCGEEWPRIRTYKFCPKCGDEMVYASS